MKAEAKENTTLRAWIFGLSTAGIGVFLLWLSAYAEAQEHLKTASVLRELGAFALVSVVLALWWEVTGKRKYTDELLAKVGMARDLGAAGIVTVTMNFRDDKVDWSSYFSQSSRLDIWVAYASTWRKQHIDRIRALLEKKDSKIRVALPNPDDDLLVGQLASRFTQTAVQVRENIQQTIGDFQALAADGAKVEIFLTSKLPIFTFYVLDNVAVLAFYNHRDGKLPVPTLVCAREGTMYQYLVNEFADLTRGECLAK